MTAMGVTLNRHSFKCVVDGFSRWLRLKQWVMACLAIAFFAGCMDTYPTEDEVSILPREMTQAQRLQAMNQLGQEAHPELTWFYRAMPDCRLQWTVQGGDAGKGIAQVPLWGSAIDLRLDKIDQVYGVQVRPAGASSLEELTLMLSKDWVQAIEMSHLLRSFQIGCSAGDAPAALGKPNSL